LCKQGGEVERTLKTQVSALQSIQSLAQGVSTAIKEEALRTSEQYKEILQVLASQKAQQENVMTGVTRTVDDILAKLNGEFRWEPSIESALLTTPYSHVGPGNQILGLAVSA